MMRSTTYGTVDPDPMPISLCSARTWVSTAAYAAARFADSIRLRFLAADAAVFAAAMVREACAVVRLQGQPRLRSVLTKHFEPVRVCGRQRPKKIRAHAKVRHPRWPTNN